MSFVTYLSESDSFSFQYHSSLHTKLWDGFSLNPKVLSSLTRIYKEFFDFLEVSPDYHVVDVLFTGSLANFNFTPYSDIDLHLVLDKSPDYCDDCGIDLRDFLDTKKNLWNSQHDISIFGFPVELYTQLQGEVLTATGVFSVLHNKWLTKPEHLSDLSDKINEYAVNIKSKDIKQQIDSLISSDSDDLFEIKELKTKIKNMRKAGLKKSGEFSVENLVFKDLRNTGYLDKLDKLKNTAYDRELSLESYLMEMPRMISNITNNLLDEPVGNNEEYRALNNQLSKAIHLEQLNKDIALYLIKTQSKTTIVALDKSKERVEYLMEYEEDQNVKFGRYVYQSFVWVNKECAICRRLPRDCFFKYVVDQEDVVLTDSLQTWDGKKFWINRLKEAFEKNLFVYYVNDMANTIIKLDNFEQVDEFDQKYQIWHQTGLHKLMAISKKELN